MSNVISHKGIIDSIEGGVAHVRITQHSACSSCKVASYCNSAESKEKLIDARVSEPSRHHVGDEVSVMAAQSVGTKAVILDDEYHRNSSESDWQRDVGSSIGHSNTCTLLRTALHAT